MDSNYPVPELVVGVRDEGTLYACSQYADAVYFSVDRLSLRSRAKTITVDNLSGFVKSVRKKGLKAYLVVNSVIYPEDAFDLSAILNAAKKAKVDAIVAWDPAVILQASSIGLDIHISTQANVSNAKTAEFYGSLGASRIILSRELSLSQIKQIRQHTDIELEVFVHGAMCQAISGRCYLSAYLLGKSGNCGQCTQPCRWEWTLNADDGSQVQVGGKYLLSARDLCMIEHIPQLVEAGIDAFKIEGRLRDSRYISTVSRCYSEALEACRSGEFENNRVPEWNQQLYAVYNRGFSTGFYFGIPSREGFIVEKDMNVSQTHKELVGEVVNYYKNQSAAYVKLTDSGLNIGDTILIEGENTHLEQHVSSMQVTGNTIKSAEKGMDVGLAVDGRVRPNDKVFRIADPDTSGNE
ncbi:peptidase U32 family protein [Methanohalophilus euhalobius]|uniref:Putative protease n=1 Tax=Methanohalophilus euhalobius TaxID=51203 RepID=A0A314ZX33_9EURY|nr:peptidase U32 family protein [Methanohalophilus euhalobius]PQV42520.1 putative protease [Methanohalophilus euhalobius]RNI08264.1 U32 family peptidase [Methanohalophilus euhalobius]